MVSLGEYARVARLRWPSLLIGVLLGLLSGLVWYQVTPGSYEARAMVTIDPITSDLFSSTPVNQLVNTATEAAIVQSVEVAERVAARNDLPDDPRDLLERLTVVVPLSSLALEIVYTGDSPEAAAEGANTFAKSYLDFRRETAEVRRARYADLLGEQLEDLGRQFAAAEAGSPDSVILGQEIGVIRTQLADATSLTISPGQLVSRAIPAPDGRSPSLRIALPAGLVLGLLAGIGLVVLRQRADGPVLTTAELRNITRLPVIGSLAPSKRGVTPGSRGSDGLALAAARLAQMSAGRERRSWLTLSVDQGRPTGAETIAWWLGRSEDVVLVRLGADAHGHPPSEHEEAAYPEAPGLRLRSAPESASARAFDFICPADGYLLLDGSGLSSLGEAFRFVETAGTVLLTVELGATTKGNLKRTLDSLEQLWSEGRETALLVIERPPGLSRLWQRRPGRRAQGRRAKRAEQTAAQHRGPGRGDAPAASGDGWTAQAPQPVGKAKAKDAAALSRWSTLG